MKKLQFGNSVVGVTIACLGIGSVIPQQLQALEIEQVSYNAADLIGSSNTPENSWNQSSSEEGGAVELAQRRNSSNGSGWAISPDVSTLGIGGMVTKSLTPNLNARLGINGFSIGADVEETDVTYDADLKLFNVSTLVDFYPFKGGGFHLTGGLVFQDNKIEGRGEITNGEITIGDETFTSNELGSVDAEVSFSNSVAPYLGIGFGNAVKPERRIGFSINLGVMFAGEPEVSLEPNFGPAATPQVQQEINEAIDNEKSELEDDINGFNIYPVLSLSLSYQF